MLDFVGKSRDPLGIEQTTQELWKFPQWALSVTVRCHNSFAGAMPKDVDR